MASNISISVAGLSDVLSELKDYGDSVKGVVSDELSSTQQDIISDAKQAAPVDLGNLRANIGPGADDDLNKEIVSVAGYSAYQEFGTGGLVDASGLEALGFDLSAYASQFKGEGKRQVNIPPKHFFYPAVATNMQKMVERLKEVLT